MVSRPVRESTQALGMRADTSYTSQSWVVKFFTQPVKLHDSPDQITCYMYLPNTNINTNNVILHRIKTIQHLLQVIFYVEFVRYITTIYNIKII